MSQYANLLGGVDSFKLSDFSLHTVQQTATISVTASNNELKTCFINTFRRVLVNVSAYTSLRVRGSKLRCEIAGWNGPHDACLKEEAWTWDISGSKGRGRNMHSLPSVWWPQTSYIGLGPVYTPLFISVWMMSVLGSRLTCGGRFWTKTHLFHHTLLSIIFRKQTNA